MLEYFCVCFGMLLPFFFFIFDDFEHVLAMAKNFQHHLLCYDASELKIDGSFCADFHKTPSRTKGTRSVAISAQVAEEASALKASQCQSIAALTRHNAGGVDNAPVHIRFVPSLFGLR